FTVRLAPHLCRLIIHPPPRTATLSPYTTLFRSLDRHARGGEIVAELAVEGLGLGPLQEVIILVVPAGAGEVPVAGGVGRLVGVEIGRAHVWTPVADQSTAPPSCSDHTHASL